MNRLRNFRFPYRGKFGIPLTVLAGGEAVGEQLGEPRSCRGMLYSMAATGSSAAYSSTKASAIASMERAGRGVGVIGHP